MVLASTHTAGGARCLRPRTAAGECQPARERGWRNAHGGRNGHDHTDGDSKAYDHGNAKSATDRFRDTTGA